MLIQYLQKENTETIKIECDRLFDQMKQLDHHTYVDPDLGVSVSFKTLFTMADGGLVSKYFGEHSSKCRICLLPMKQFRDQQMKAEAEGRLDKFMSDLYIHPGSLDFGGSPTHTKIHVGMLLLDWASRKEFKRHGAHGFSDLKKMGEKEVHDSLIRVLGIRVNEPRTGKLAHWDALVHQ